jgi:hypothetical protein
MRMFMGVLALAGLAGCSKDDTDDTDIVIVHVLTFSGSGYDDHNDKTVTALVEDNDGETAGGDAQTATVANGAFQFTFPDIPQGDYHLYWYIDLSGDNTCQTPPTDFVWSHAFTVAQTDVIVDTDPDQIVFDSAGCSHLNR